MGIEFITAASGSRANAYMVSDGQTTLLLEAGLRIKEMRRRFDSGVAGADGALITHEHGDHARGVPDLLKAGVDVYATAGTIDTLSLQSHRLHTIRRCNEVCIGSWTILAFDTVHDAAEPVGFLLYSRAAREKLLFVTDTAYIPHRFRGLNHIAIEANFCEDILRDHAVDLATRKRILQNHMSIQRVLRMLAANDLSQLHTIHLLHLSDERSDAEQFRLQVQSKTGKPVYIAGSN